MELYSGNHRGSRISPACLEGAAISLVQLPTSSVDEDEPWVLHWTLSWILPPCNKYGV